MSTVFLHIHASLIKVDFFGFAINIHKDHYIDDFFIALDPDGELYMYSKPPHIDGDQWSVNPFTDTYSVVDLFSYYKLVPDLEDWVLKEWNTTYWRITEFPVLRTA